MAGRNKVLMISLASLLVLGLGAGWLLLDPDAGKTRPGNAGKALRSEGAQLSDDDIDRAGAGKGGPADPDDPQSGPGRNGKGAGNTGSGSTSTPSSTSERASSEVASP